MNTDEAREIALNGQALIDKGQALNKSWAFEMYMYGFLTGGVTGVVVTVILYALTI